MVFPSFLSSFFSSLLSFKQACRSLLSKFVNSCNQMQRAGQLTLMRGQVKLVAFNHRSFDWKFVCRATGQLTPVLSSTFRQRCSFGKLEIESFVHFVVYLNIFFDGTIIIYLARQNMFYFTLEFDVEYLRVLLEISLGLFSPFRNIMEKFRERVWLCKYAMRI